MCKTVIAKKIGRSHEVGKHYLKNTHQYGKKIYPGAPKNFSERREITIIKKNQI